MFCLAGLKQGQAEQLSKSVKQDLATMYRPFSESLYLLVVVVLNLVLSLHGAVVHPRRWRGRHRPVRDRPSPAASAAGAPSPSRSHHPVTVVVPDAAAAAAVHGGNDGGRAGRGSGGAGRGHGRPRDAESAATRGNKG